MQYLLRHHRYYLVSSIYPPYSWDVINVKHRAIVTQTHFRRYRQYHACLFFIWLLNFFYGICRCETDTWDNLSHHTKYLLGKISFSASPFTFKVINSASLSVCKVTYVQCTMFLGNIAVTPTYLNLVCTNLNCKLSGASRYFTVVERRC